MDDDIIYDDYICDDREIEMPERIKNMTDEEVLEELKKLFGDDIEIFIDEKETI